MAREPRIQYAGACCHVLCRGSRRDDIFVDEQDRKIFLDTLGDVCERTGWGIHAYVLLENHYHGLIETPEANLVKGMGWFQAS